VELPTCTRERPGCRQAVEHLCRKKGLSVPELWAAIQARTVFVTDGIKKQCRKMAAEYHRQHC
jgi:hypothetical protein